MKKILLLIILILSTAIQAADTELQDMVEMTAIVAADALYVVDDPLGAPASRFITALNLFDMIDTFAELQAITADETLVSEEGTPTLDALWTFDLGLTITTGDPLTFGVNRIDNGADLLDGEMIGADTIDDDSIDWADCTLADFDFETAWKMFHSDAAGDVIEITLGANGTFLESNGAAANPAFRALVDGDIPDNITIDLATLATTVTLANDNATNDDQDIIFTADAAGPVNLEADTGDFHYNPSTGTVTATQFVGGGAGITGTLTAYDDIADPDAASSITFQDGETVTWATQEDSAGSFFLIQDSDAALAANTYLLDLDYSVDDNEANADYFRCQDAGGVVFSIQQDGDTMTTGDLNVIGATTFGTAATLPGNLGMYDAGTLTIYEDGDNFNITLACNSGEAVGTLTGGIDITGLTFANANLEVGNAAASAGVLTIHEDTDEAGAEFASFTVPALAASTVYTLPPDDGDNTEVLQTNGGGTLTWVANAGAGATAWDDISDPDNNGLTTITFDNAELTLFTGDNDAAASFVTIQNTDGDHTVGQLYLLDLDYSADDGDAEADYIRCQDSGGDVFTVGQDGELAMDGGATIGGSMEAATITEGLIGVPNLNEIDWVAAAEMADADHGDVQWAGGDASVQACDLLDTVYASCYVGLFQAATGADNIFYTDAGLTYDATSGTLSSTILTEGGLAVYNSGETPSGSLGGTYANITIDDLFILLGGDVATAGDYDFGGANVDLELPQTSPAVPDVDGQVEVDFTDGKVVIQHSSGHAELGASTDVVVGSLIKSWGGTIYEPDGVNDVITVKAINSIEFPHGVVITAVYLGVSSDDGYVLTVQNFDDFDTISAGNPTIDTVTYPADATGEIIDSTPTFATIAAGQIIMVSIPATDVDWIHFEIYYYEPAA